jgi:hypothetical protein
LVRGNLGIEGKRTLRRGSKDDHLRALQPVADAGARLVQMLRRPPDALRVRTPPELERGAQVRGQRTLRNSSK